jgi:hypothetical protein
MDPGVDRFPSGCIGERAPRRFWTRYHLTQGRYCAFGTERTSWERRATQLGDVMASDAWLWTSRATGET